MLANGVFLNDRYEILGRVGSGGMSDVYKAKCHKLNRYVAIKVLKQEYSEDKNFVAKFRVEAQSAAGLSHPNIVSIYDVGEDNGLYYIVMELVEGITLKNYIEKKGQLDVKEAVSIAIQVAQGIQTAHSHHIIHRDIKPQNIIISKEGKVKVTDFGIARVSSAQTINSNAMGSVHYISPEQARGNYSDERSDIYSLGISLYEMITGRVPFDGDTTVAVALAHIQSEMVSPRTYVPDLPISVEKIIYKCTQKKPVRRYAKAGDLIADLKQSLLTPDEDFVQIQSLSSTAPTIAVTPRELGYNRTEIEKENVEDTETIREEIPPQVVAPERSRQPEETVQEENPPMKKGYIESEADDDDEQVNPKVEKVMTVISVAAAILIVCLLVFIIAKLLPKAGKKPSVNTPTTTTQRESTSTTESNTSTDATTTTTNTAATSVMPDLKNLSESDALIALNQVNLGMDKSYVNSKDVKKGYVVSQEYEAGTKVKKNTSVGVVISSGPGEPEKFKMPDVINLKESDAVTLLKNYNLNPSPEYIYSDDIIKGNVVSTKPSESTLVSEGDTVVLNISMGPEFSEVIMPDLKGLTEAEAKFELESKGLIVGNIEQVYSSEIEEGHVISQSLTKGGKVKQGTTVDFVVSKGEETTEPETTTEETTTEETTIEETTTEKETETTTKETESLPTASVTINRSQIAEYLSSDGTRFSTPVIPSPNMEDPTYYSEATLRLELVQTTDDGKTISRIINTTTVTPSNFPYVQQGITGEAGLIEGSVKVYLSFGGKEYSCGSCLVDFK